MTGYKATKLINEVLAGHGLKAIPPQMTYQYISKGYIKSTDVNGRAEVSEEQVNEWLDKYLARKLEAANA
jgi:predicted site-specific integrase-resolvase